MFNFKTISVAALVLALGLAPALAGQSTIGATAGSGALIRVGTDASGNIFGNSAICDGPACALMASVNAAGTTGTNGLAVQGMTGGVPFTIVQSNASLLNTAETNSTAILAAVRTAAQISDGTNGNVGVAPSSSSAAANVPSLIVQHSPNDPVTGAPGATACASDTASCNLNQQLQRIAQRLTAVITGQQPSANVTLNDCSGTVTTGNAANNAFTGQTTLHGFTIANIDNTIGSGEPLWFSFTGTGGIGAAGSYPLAAPTATTYAGLSSYTTPPGMGTNHALSVIAGTSGHKFSCTWW